MGFTLTRAIRVLADCLGSSTSRRNAAAATNAIPPSFRRNRRKSEAAPCVEPLEQRALMTTYYVSPFGNDANRGTSTSAAWKSINKVNATVFHAGDDILFQGNQTFYGAINVHGGTNGTPAAPVTFGSYNGRATLNTGKATEGAYVLNASGVAFENLKFVGSPSGSQQDGIRFETTPSNYKRPFAKVDDCDISGYGRAGILVMGDSSNSGFTGVSLTNNKVYNNVNAGILTFNNTPNGIDNVYVGYNEVYNNYGNPNDTVSGSGIELAGVNGATVEHNSAHDNGAHSSGEVGIWAYSSNAVNFQYNESFNNHGTKSDGDGFDFDADTSNSVMQYNFAANNDGSGFILCQWENDNTETGNVIRYNIAQNNGRRNNYAGIDLWGKVLNTQVYNNVVYTSPASNGQPSAVRLSNNGIGNLFVDGAKISDNIFVTTGGAPVVNVQPAESSGAKGVSFTGNVYYGYNGTNISYAGHNYTSLAAWQSATGQEKVNGKSVGLIANPLFYAPGSVVPSTNTASLSSITAYNLPANSPALSAGVNVNQLYGVSTPAVDFHGSPASSVAAPGVDQSHTGKYSTTPVTAPTPAPVTAPVATPVTTIPTTTSGVSGKMTGWDVGSPGKAGGNFNAGSNYTVTAGGADVWGSSDSFRYVFETLTGNGQIVAKVASVGNSNSWAKAGVMIRNSATAANSAEVSMSITPSGQAAFQARYTAGGATVANDYAAKGDQWVKLVRSGNTFTSYMSANGINWTLVGSTVAAMNNTVSIGLAVTAHNNGSTTKASFQNVSIS